MKILVDSSVWIAAANPKNKECWQLKNLIKEQRYLYVSLPIQVEVCQGARTQVAFEKLWDSFLGFSFLEITEHHWEKNAWNYFQCRKQGITAGTLDCLIATLSSDYRVSLWTLDKDYSLMKPIIGFELFKYSKP